MNNTLKTAIHITMTLIVLFTLMGVTVSFIEFSNKVFSKDYNGKTLNRSR